jgi:Ca2+-binding RTX toxin-like protein
MRRTTTLVALVTLLVALGAARGVAQGIPIVFCAEQEPETPECRGTDSFESLVGQETRDVIRALAGDDIVNAEAGDDEAFGGFGVDNMTGSFGNERLFGGRGPDTLNDGLTPSGEVSTGDVDELFGNRGNDVLRAEDDDFRDTVECGRGAEDFAFFDENGRTGKSDAVGDDCEFQNEFPVSVTDPPSEPDDDR